MTRMTTPGSVVVDTNDEYNMTSMTTPGSVVVDTNDEYNTTSMTFSTVNDVRYWMNNI